MSTALHGLPTIKAHAQMTQAMMLARVLHGKLSELWTVLGKGYFGTKLSRIYSPLLDVAGAAGIGALKNYFGPANLVNTVRNKFAFHYSLDQALTNIPDDMGPEELTILMHETDHGSSLYYFAEFLMRKALLEAITPGEQSDSLDEVGAAQSMKKFFSEMTLIVDAANNFSHDFISLVIAHHVGLDALRATSCEVIVADVPESSAVQIPFFITISPPKAEQ